MHKAPLDEFDSAPAPAAQVSSSSAMYVLIISCPVVQGDTLAKRIKLFEAALDVERVGPSNVEIMLDQHRHVSADTDTRVDSGTSRPPPVGATVLAMRNAARRVFYAI